MTGQEKREARDTWTYQRAAFQRRSDIFPELAQLLPIIDAVCSEGYGDRLYASTALDNLLISTRRKPGSRKGAILVLLKPDAIEFRLFKNNGDALTSEVRFDQAPQEVGRLLSILTEPVPAN